jgi:ABC-type polysaccharide/polyol phosphate export permease
VVQASLTAWFYVTPVIYPLDRVPESLQGLLQANPMTGVVQLFRTVVLGVDGVDLFPALAWSIATAAALLVVGILLQARYNRVCVDLL